MLTLFGQDCPVWSEGSGVQPIVQHGRGIRQGTAGGWCHTAAVASASRHSGVPLLISASVQQRCDKALISSVLLNESLQGCTEVFDDQVCNHNWRMLMLTVFSPLPPSTVIRRSNHSCQITIPIATARSRERIQRNASTGIRYMETALSRPNGNRYLRHAVKVSRCCALVWRRVLNHPEPRFSFTFVASVTAGTWLTDNCALGLLKLNRGTGNAPSPAALLAAEAPRSAFEAESVSTAGTTTLAPRMPTDVFHSLTLFSRRLRASAMLGSCKFSR